MQHDCNMIGNLWTRSVSVETMWIKLEVYLMMLSNYIAQDMLAYSQSCAENLVGGGPQNGEEREKRGIGEKGVFFSFFYATDDLVT